MASTKPNDLNIDLEKGETNGIQSTADEKKWPLTPSPSNTTTLTQNGSPRSSQASWKLSLSHWLPGGAPKVLEVDESINAAKPKAKKTISPRRESIVRKLEECPAGFPRLAAFLDSDDNFMLYRRFGFLHARILLQKQDELKHLEAKLDLMDDDDKEKNPNCLRSRIDDEERGDVPEGEESRKELLRRAEVLVKEYGQLLLQAQSLVGMKRPGNRDYKSVSGYIGDTKPLFEGEDDFIDRREDLVTLRPGRECAWLDAFVERVLKAVRCGPVKRMFCSADVLRKTDEKNIYYFSRDRIDCLVTSLITIFIMLLLIVPIYVLYRVSSASDTPRSNTTCIGVLLVAALVFSAILSLFTKARRHEILGASAAYCAVLVVFIGNVGPRGS